jgi:hypothetical protein
MLGSTVSEADEQTKAEELVPEQQLLKQMTDL